MEIRVLRGFQNYFSILREKMICKREEKRQVSAKRFLQ